MSIIAEQVCKSNEFSDECITKPSGFRVINYDGVEKLLVLSNSIMFDSVARFLAQISNNEEKKCYIFSDKYSNIIGTWVVQHYLKYGEAPKRTIERYFSTWADEGQIDREEVNLVSRLLERANNLHTESEVPYSESHLIECTRNLFNKEKLTRLRDNIEILLENGRITDALRRIENFKPYGEQQVVDRFPTFGWDSIDNAVGEPHLIENLLVENQPCVIGAPAKCLKTWLSLDLATSLTTGEPFLGDPRFKVLKRASVLMLSGESGISTLQKNRRTIRDERCALSLKKRTEWLPFELSPNVPRFDRKLDMQDIETKLKKGKFGVLIVDPLTRAVSGEHASNLYKMQEQLGAISDMCQQFGVTFIVNHHTKTLKEKNKPLDLDDLTYTGPEQHFRQWVLLSRRVPFLALDSQTQKRNHQLWMRIGGSAGHSGTYGLDINEGTAKKSEWKVLISQQDETYKIDSSKRDEGRKRKEEEKVISYLNANKDGASKETIRASCGFNSASKLQTALENLLSTGKLEKCTLLRNGRTYPAYRTPNK